MAANLLKILSIRIRVRSLILFALCALYFCLSLYLFFQWVAPSLDGRTNRHIAADSATYIHYADSLREGRGDPLVIAALSSFPNNLWCPVLLALILKSTLAMVLANYAFLFLALVLLKKSFSFSTGSFLALLTLNATTTISLLSVNKEILDLLAVSVFIFAYRRHHSIVLLLALSLAFFNRFEVCIVMLLFLFFESRINPLRQRRAAALVALVVVLSVMLPLSAAKTLSDRFGEADTGGTVAWLDSLEMHYMYGVAVIPKIAENLFAELINASKWKSNYNFDDLANSYIVFFNNLANVIVLIVLAMKRTLSLRHDIVYFATVGCIMMGISLVIQPRYFYFVYVLLCLQAAQPGMGRPLDVPWRGRRPEIANA
jgi:hypothetical protein